MRSSMNVFIIVALIAVLVTTSGCIQPTQQPQNNTTTIQVQQGSSYQGDRSSGSPSPPSSPNPPGPSSPSGYYTCPTCDGWGVVPDGLSYDPETDEWYEVYVNCPTCGGSGVIYY